ncbi:MAG: pilus assembly protein PilM [Planctomycetales bacterium]|nr:pilus assembly protein PilM [Planctomycetales bacterium]
MLYAKTQGWVGIDVGTNCVKLAQVARVNGQFNIVDAAIVPRQRIWTSDIFDNDEPSSTEDEIATALSIASRCSNRRSAICTTMKLCRFAAQSSSVGILDDAVRRQLGVGGDARHIVDHLSASGATNETLFFAMSSKWSEQIAIDAKRAGLRCEVIDALPLALARALALDPTVSKHEATIGIDWGYSTVTLCVARNGRACFVRNLPRCGLRRVVDDVAVSLNLSTRDANDMLVRHGVGGHEDHRLSKLFCDVARSSIDEMATEIEKTMRFMDSHFRSDVPNSVRVFGGGAQIPGLTTQLGKTLGITTVAWQFACSSQPDNLAMLGPAIALSALAWESTR